MWCLMVTHFECVVCVDGALVFRLSCRSTEYPSGVPDYEYPSLDQAAIMAELEKKYPDFEKRTGWRLDSEYKEEIPEALANEASRFLCDFFGSTIAHSPSIGPLTVISL